MDLKSNKYISIGIDSVNEILCDSNEVSYLLYEIEKLEELKSYIEKTLNYYSNNNINDEIICFLNKQAIKERTACWRQKNNLSDLYKQRKSGLYLISAGKEFVKIGRAENVENRLKVLKIGNPYELKTMFFIKGLGKCEGSVHKYFKDYRFDGEWFRYNQEIINSFKIIEENRNALMKLNGKIDLDYYIEKIFKK